VSGDEIERLNAEIGRLREALATERVLHLDTLGKLSAKDDEIELLRALLDKSLSVGRGIIAKMRSGLA